MADIRSFRALRPRPELANKVAARPYDVLNSKEARKEAGGNPYSFLRITKPEIDLPSNMDMYDNAVYQQARINLELFVDNGTLIQDDKRCLYLYRQIMGDHSQVGIVACSSVDDYFNDVIKKHEFTRPEKERDRIRHMATLRAHVGPVFLTYPDVDEINKLVEEYMNGNNPVYDFMADDQVQHTVWVIDDSNLLHQIESLFEHNVPYTYIADGHHRAASSAKVKEGIENEGGIEGNEHYYFLSVLFPSSQLMIIDYNRIVADLNGLNKEQFLASIKEVMDVEFIGASQVKPSMPHEYGMYLDSEWYKLTAKPGSFDTNDPIDVLDISVISDQVLDPILGIKDQRTDKRIDFVGGIRGLGELERRVNEGGYKVAFAIYPVSIQQLIDIADSGNVMPPKSTWFEPKLRSGLLIHEF